MKKLLAVAAAVSIMMSSAAFVHCEDDIKVLLDGKEISFDVPPQIINDRTVVPFRAIFEALGYEVEWFEEYRNILAVNDRNSINMTIGRNTAFMFGEGVEANPDAKNEIDFNDPSLPQGVIDGAVYYQVDLDVPPQIINDRTMVPVRAVSEMSGYKVDWEPETRTVSIDSPVNIVTGPGPVIPEASEAPEATEAPKATEAPAATEAPKASGDLPITFNAVSEQGVGYERNFKLLTAEKNADGKYDITFEFETYQEGPGSVAVTYNCLDAGGKVVDTFGGSFKSVDYTPTMQKGSATISGDTVTIELTKNSK